MSALPLRSSFLLGAALAAGCMSAGDRQIADHRVAVAHGSGGVLSTMGTVVLGTEETL